MARTLLQPRASMEWIGMSNDFQEIVSYRGKRVARLVPAGALHCDGRAGT